MNKNTTRRSLLASVFTLALCAIMLVGTTFAWFTDTASTSVNKIQAGNLKVDIVDENGNSLNGKTLSFKNVNGETDILWEPGATFNLDSFKIVNKGNLALKYKVVINGVSGDNKLLKAIDFTVKSGSAEPVVLADWDGILLPDGKASTADNEKVGATDLITISGTMKKDAGNEYQGLSIDGISITVVATQYTYESDSFGKTYDEKAEAEITVNKDNIQDYLDGKYGSIDGMTLVLAAGDYGTLELGRATAYAGSNTKYYTFKGGYAEQTEIKEYATAEELKTTLADTNTYHGNLKYVRSLNNVTFKAAAGAKVNIAGVSMESAHMYGTESKTVHDYVLNNDIVDTNKSFWLVHHVNGIKFEGLNFTGNVNISSSLEEASIDGVTFDRCTFTTNGTNSDKGQALRYYNENNNGQVKNLTVKDCTFTNCYQGVYTMQVRGVSVTGSKFDTTGHSAIAVQSQGGEKGACNHGAVVITNNTFDKIGSNVIRFNEVGADTQITISGNTATNSNKAMEAGSLADGITYNISGNSWGGGRVVNPQLADK